MTERADRLDLAVGVVIVALLVVIGVVVLRGDQLGITAQNITPQSRASTRSAIHVTFDEALANPASGAVSVAPPIQGKLSVNQDQLSFVPAQPLTQGQDYTITVRAGLAATTGRVLKQDLQWHFRVMPPRIVYLGPADNIVENLYLVDPAAPDKSQPLTTGTEGVNSFDVSPDGSSIVYATLQPDGGANLYLWDAASGTSRLLYECKDASCTNPVWRPDGGAIAFERSAVNANSNVGPGVPRPWLYDMSASAAHPIFKDNQQIGYLMRWSPDGNLLAMVDTDVNGGILIHNFSTGKDAVIQATQGDIGSFSPDGKWLYFPKIAPGNQTHLVLIDVSSPYYTQHDLIPDDDPSDDSEAAWMPDSKALLVLRKVDPVGASESLQMFRVDITTGAATSVINDPSYIQTNLSISPAGDTVLLQRFSLAQPGSRPEIWTYNLGNGQLQKVFENGSLPHWLP